MPRKKPPPKTHDRTHYSRALKRREREVAAMGEALDRTFSAAPRKSEEIAEESR